MKLVKISKKLEEISKYQKLEVISTSEPTDVLIHISPAINPAGFFIQFWLVLLAAACSCCIAFTQATTGRCWQLAHRGQETQRQGR